MRKTLASQMKLPAIMLGFVLLLPAVGQAADTMDNNMQAMQKNMDELKGEEHCMPNMMAHCQMIADLDYMQGRMADMKRNMKFCMSNAKDCPMPEMVGEMRAMKQKMNQMMKDMQSLSESKEGNAPQLLPDTRPAGVTTDSPGHTTHHQP